MPFFVSIPLMTRLGLARSRLYDAATLSLLAASMTPIAANASYEVVMDIFEANRKGATVQDPLSGLYGPRRLTYDLSGNEQG